MAKRIHPCPWTPGMVLTRLSRGDLRRQEDGSYSAIIKPWTTISGRTLSQAMIEFRVDDDGKGGTFRVKSDGETFTFRLSIEQA